MTNKIYPELHEQTLDPISIENGPISIEHSPSIEETHLNNDKKLFKVNVRNAAAAQHSSSKFLTIPNQTYLDKNGTQTTIPNLQSPT